MKVFTVICLLLLFSCSYEKIEASSQYDNATKWLKETNSYFENAGSAYSFFSQSPESEVAFTEDLGASLGGSFISNIKGLGGAVSGLFSAFSSTNKQAEDFKLLMKVCSLYIHIRACVSLPLLHIFYNML